MSDRRGGERPSFGAVLSNWRESDTPFLTKLRQAVKNDWRKLRTRQSCCGNDGQPGC
jgi:hypothetical protein